MKISLKVDYDGIPYIVLLSEKRATSHADQCLEAEVLEHFIKKAKINGIEIINENFDGLGDNYASIRIKKVSE